AVRLSGPKTPHEPWKIVNVQPLGDKIPIIAINHPVMYRKLARSLGVDRRFVSIQLFDPHTPQALTRSSIEEIAAAYVRLIRIAQPVGPYILIGLCDCGVVAYE